VAFPENIDDIHSIILSDWRISAKKKAETLVVSQERVAHIRHGKALSQMGSQLS
jgi:hypothetical protein